MKGVKVWILKMEAENRRDLENMWLTPASEY